MPTKRTKARARRPDAKRRTPVHDGRVRELLLELTYRLHATRPVATVRPPTGSVA